jgi:hypothetical protein
MRVENRDGFLDSRDLVLLACGATGERTGDHNGWLCVLRIAQLRV